MSQQFHTFRGATLDEAYREMRRRLGDTAIVVRTAQVRPGGILGFFARPEVEITASVAAPAAAARTPTPLEKKYAAAPAASDAKVTDTVAYFERLVTDAQKRMRASEARAVASAPADAAGSVLAFKKPAEPASARDDLRREIAQMRDMLQVLMAETPGAGIPAEFAPHYRTLLDRGVGRSQAAALMAAVVRDSDLDVLRDPRVFAERLKVEIRRRVAVTGGLPLNAGACRVVAFVGPTGVGKTTSLAKLAAQYAVRERARVALVTADTYRVAAPEQLRVYANIIGLPMKVVHDARTMAAAVRGFRDHDLVLIDTAGGSQFNMKQIQELKETLAGAAPDEVVLTLAANTQLEELRAVVANFQCTGPRSILFSKLDETRRFGVVYSVAVESGLPLSHFCIGQNVPDDIVLARPAMLANLIVEGREKRGRSSS